MVLLNRLLSIPAFTFIAILTKSKVNKDDQTFSSVRFRITQSAPYVIYSLTYSVVLVDW